VAIGHMVDHLADGGTAAAVGGVELGVVETADGVATAGGGGS